MALGGYVVLARREAADRRAARPAPPPRSPSGSRGREARHGGPHRGLRAHPRPARRRAGRPRRLDRLAVLPAVRLRGRASPPCSARGATATGGSRPATAATCTQPALPRRHDGPGDRVGHARAASVRVIDFMPERDEAPDVVRIVEGIDGPGGHAQRAAAAVRLRRRRAVGAPPRRHARGGRRPGRGVARLRRAAPRPRLRVVRRLHRRGRPARDLRAHLEPVVPAPAVPGRPAGRAGRRPSGSGRLGRRGAPTTAPTATPSCGRCSPSRR